MSIATVSRVINNKGNVSSKTTDKIIKVMNELGYTPNIFARGLNLDSMKSIGILCTTVEDMFYAKAVEIIENNLRKNGYDSILCCTGNDLEDKKNCIELLLSKRVDALIFIGSVFKESDNNIHIIEAAKSIPVVMLNSLIEDIDNIYCILCDEGKAMERNVQILYEANCKNILYAYDRVGYSGQTKLKGYINGISSVGLELKNEMKLCVSGEPNQIIEKFLERFKISTDFSAIVATDDLIASCAIKACIMAGLKVPEDVCVIGFNNSWLCDCICPSITSVDNKIVALAEGSVKLLLDIFNKKNPPSQTIISSDIIFRESFKKLKGV